MYGSPPGPGYGPPVGHGGPPPGPGYGGPPPGPGYGGPPGPGYGGPPPGGMDMMGGKGGMDMMGGKGGPPGGMDMMGGKGGMDMMGGKGGGMDMMGGKGGGPGQKGGGGPMGGPPPGYGGPPQGPQYGEFNFGGQGGGGGQQPENIDIFVEATPEIQPNFQRGSNGTFEMYVSGIVVKLTTSCNPQPRQYPGLSPFKPYEQFTIALPEVQRVIFDPNRNMPPDGRAWCQASKRGAVCELPPHITMNAKLKTDSPYGSLILEDMQIQGDYKQKVGETVLNYRLQVDGQLAVGHGSGNMGANRLEVELNFTFDCYLGGPPVAQPESQGPPPGGGLAYGGPPSMGGGGPGYGGPPGGGGGPGFGGPPPGPGYGGPPGYGGW